MAVTAKELASQLGLSEAAVSLALNNKPGVSTETRRRVLEAARARGYDLTRKAQARKAKIGAFCFVIYKKSGAVVDDTPFFSALSDGAGLGCKSLGYDFSIRYLYGDDDLDEQLFVLKNAGFTGLILLATEMDEATLRRFASLSIPFVVLDACFETVEQNYILINNVQGAFLATSHLITRRRAQPGYLRSAYPISNFEQRADGFYKAIRAAGLSTSKSLVHRLTPSQEGAYADMRALLQNGEEPADCYFADNDHIAIGAIRALKEAGYRIPEDVAVVGFDDLPICSYLSPPLSTVYVPVHYMGKTAACRLARIIEEKDELPVKIEISTSLKKRKSV